MEQLFDVTPPITVPGCLKAVGEHCVLGKAIIKNESTGMECWTVKNPVLQ